MSDAPADDLARLAAALENPNAYRGAADDLLRGIGIGPVELARLSLVPKSERRKALAAMLPTVAVAVEAKASKPPAEATLPATAPAVVPAVAPKVDNLPTWRLDHLRRHGRA